MDYCFLCRWTWIYFHQYSFNPFVLQVLVSTMITASIPNQSIYQRFDLLLKKSFFGSTTLNQTDNLIVTHFTNFVSILARASCPL